MSGASRPTAGANLLNAAIQRPELRSQAANRSASTPVWRQEKRPSPTSRGELAQAGEVGCGQPVSGQAGAQHILDHERGGEQALVVLVVKHGTGPHHE